MARSTILVAALLLAGPLALAQDIRELARLGQDPDPQVRGKAARDLGKLQSLDAAALLVRMLADSHDYVHDEAVDALVGFSDEKVFAFLSDGALRGARDPRSLAGLARACARLKLADAVPRLLKALPSIREEAAVAVLEALAILGGGMPDVADAVADRTRSPDWKTRAAAIETIARLSGAAKLEAIDAGCTDREFQVRIAALEAIESFDRPLALEKAKALLADPHWSVRVAAIQVMVRSKDKSVIPLLVAQLKNEDGRLKKDIGDALRALAASGGADDGGSVVTFYGLQIYSKRVIFVIDLSQGMKEKAAGTNQSRIAVAQEQYVECLKGYSGEGHFNLVVFATECQPWQSRMQRATPQTKTQSAAWLDKMVQAWIYGRSTGRTNIYDSLALAFEDPNVDTVVFLSDATSITEGTYQTKTDMLRKLLEKNRYRKFRFHMIGVGKKDKAVARSLMDDLAKATGGTFLETD